MVKILGTGISGLVGSRITELLPFEFEEISWEKGIDIRDERVVKSVITSSDAEIVLHLAAKADVDGCEKDKEKGKNGDAWQINVVGTENIVAACRETNKKIIYISTDFVFDGNAPDGGYKEEDEPNPINWYAATKREGEKVVMNSGLPFIIVRIAYPYRAEFALKKDFVRNILSKLKDGTTIKSITDHIMTPTFIDDIACGLGKLIESNSIGIYHLVGSQFVNPYDAAVLIANTFGLDKNLITKTTRQEYFKGRAQRPFNLSLSNDKIQQLGVKMFKFQDGLNYLKDKINI
ncbi:MAG: SDR family oxidoreductase [Candidatus Levybacteria bacterium]|nr:SDR family oxidoreductase [Candidatus Levybacteria bacterium]